MSANATGTPTTNYSFPTFNVGVDNPNGLGVNEMMAAIDGILSGASGSAPLLTTTGDMLYASGAKTPARLGIGSSGNVLTVSGGVPMWEASTATGGMSLLMDYTVTGSVVATIDTNTILGGNIPQTSKHLRVYISLRSDAATTNTSARMKVNNDGGSNYDWVSTSTDGSTTSLASTSADVTAWLGSTTGASSSAGKFSGISLDIYDYASTAKQKAYTSSSTNISALLVTQAGGSWDSTSAITRLAWFPGTGNCAIGSRVTIYGLN